MGRNKKNRIVKYNPDVNYFKPRGIPMFDLEEVSLTVDEREAMRLADFLGMSHEEAGKEMGVSRATFGRIVQNARKIIADAMINGKAIMIEGGNFNVVDDSRRFNCRTCDHKWDEPFGIGRPEQCPSCNDVDIWRIRAD
ncbi:MAG: DUF134 domain-containing protein [Deltaproteobacteria bacterium]|nr:DUF134 domain-containing protein [Deltaproteobacteria bacterium]MBW1815408.1 DUF134 domain-containing protein [Deltaproteobacteria bacterium]MBW1848044.1 DUF134 domain-containing protein [Deltaproteobacteria bacterium]MBW2182048.1 DUF134 domain-containing protein [Deltaproteobacteria bacterium]